MGAGRKTKSLTLKEKTQPSWTVNCSASARNLRKSDLGAVIFGCKNNTIEECYFKQLFGLPAPHFAYVKNISPGLPLFLFNYSDRKLHGIFEAASQGQMNINPYGWTADGSEYTPYGAQVRVQIRMHCQPLNEDQFRPVIAENYYEPRLFWFELDRAQTRRLISLFSSSPVSASASLPQNPAMWSTLFSASTSDARGGHDIDALVSQAGLMNLNQSDLQCNSCKEDEGTEKFEKELAMPKPNAMSSYASVLSSTTTSLPQKKWSALFESPATCNTRKEDGNFKARASEVNFPASDEDNVEWVSSYVALCLEEENQHFEAHPDESANFEEVRVDLKSESELTHPFALTEAASSFRQSTLWEDLIVDMKQEGEFFDAVDSDGNLPHPNKSNGERGSLSATSHLYGESQSSEASRNDDVTEIREDLLHPKTNCECSHSSAVVKEMYSNDKLGKETVPPSVMAKLHPEDECFPEAVAAAEMNSSNHSVVAKLLQEIEGLKVSQLKQVQKISSLELELVESKVEIEQLKTRFYKLDSGLLSSTGHVQEAANELCDEPCRQIDKSILIVGGFDGSSWLSSLSSYFPSRDMMKSLKPMNFVRSYASAATLNDELYIFGGVDGDVWHDTVESYNPASDQWVRRPSLNQKKGSLAGASLYGKIFAIGGGNGVECYSGVEVLDVNVDRWINTQAMLRKRFAPAAAEINGTLYVVGGYDGRNYLKFKEDFRTPDLSFLSADILTRSVERFDPREQSWMSLGSMSTRRGCHSLTALNEKLYALGGFDGSKMVSTVEIYDPRHGSWTMGEPMNDVRGYSGAAVIGEKIFIVGGIKNNDEILSTIECYREGCGWEVTNLKGVGKRCFFSATVL